MFFILFLILLLIDAGIGTLAYYGWRRVSRHLKAHPEAAKLLAEHVVGPFLVGPFLVGVKEEQAEKEEEP